MKSVSQAKGPDYYELLDVDASASHDQIRTAYRRLARQLHPDAGGNAGVFRLVREAFETLSDPIACSHYDAVRNGSEPPADTAAPATANTRLNPEDLGQTAKIPPPLLPYIAATRRRATASEQLQFG